jgi:hypothetical protein
MALLIFTSIIISLWHYYFQNVILPVLILSKTKKLMEILDDLTNLRRKNTISAKSYDAIKLVINYTCILFTDESEFQSLIEQPIKNSADLKDDETYKGFESIKNSSNYEAKELIVKYFDSVKTILSYRNWGWIIYIFPLILFKYFKIKIKSRASLTSNNWAGNVILYARYRTLKPY